MLRDANDFTLKLYIGYQKWRYEFYAKWLHTPWLLVCLKGEHPWSMNDFSLIISAIEGLHSHIDAKSSCWPAWELKRQVTCSLPHPRNERAWSITNFWSCIFDYHWAARQHWAIITVLAVFMGTKPSDDIATTFSNWASTEHQQFFIFHLG